ncbi:MAG: carbohydrate-binding protein [Chitinivibrionales bacterium]|nr:carbohydrate-binding protein [Chitinivibrionales bacterium]
MKTRGRIASYIAAFAAIHCAVPAELLAAVNPADTVFCTVYDSSQSQWVCTYDSSNDGKYCSSRGIGSFHIDDWVMYRDVDFGSGYAYMYVFYSCGDKCGCLFEFRVDDVDAGTLILTNEQERLKTFPTGGWRGGVIHRLPMDETITGIHDLYIKGALCGEPGGTGIIDLKWFLLSNDGYAYTFYDATPEPYISIPQVTPVKPHDFSEKSPSIIADRHSIVVNLNNRGAHTIRLLRPDGTMLVSKSTDSRSTILLPTEKLAPGLYILKITMRGMEQFQYRYLKQ